MSRRPPEVDQRRLQGVPRVRWIQKGNTDDAADAIALASHYRLVPDRWQCEAIDTWLSRRPDGKWVHKRNGFAVPRQNGKNGALEVRELFGLIYLGEGILHTAHEVKTARKAFKRLMSFFGEKRDDPNAKYSELNSLVAEVRNTNGQEGIFLKDLYLADGVEVRSIGRPEGLHVEFLARGGFIEFATRTGAGGRGSTYDLLVIDEAQHLSDDDLAAVRPVISSGALGNSQIIYLGTPPDPEMLDKGLGEAWVRVRALAGKAKDLGWIEYGAPDGPLPDFKDMALLYASNPSLGVRHGNGNFGLDFETVDGERGELSPESYARERLGWWGNPEAKRHRGVIDMDQWRTLRVSGNELPARGLIVVDCSPDLDWTSIALATDGPNGRPLGLVDRHEGTAWVVESVKHLNEQLDKVLEVALTPSAKGFSAALTAAGIEHRILSSTDLGAACMAYQQMVRESGTVHVGQPVLDISARQAVTKISGDTQQWDRRNRKVDISALVAVSVAVHLWSLAVAKPAEKVGVPRRHGEAPTRRPARKAPSRKPDARRPRTATSRGLDPRSSGF